MWLMTQIGFFSIVDKGDSWEEDALTVRARCYSDLLALRALYLPEASPIEHSDKNDYRYRIRAPRDAASRAIAKLVSDIDYPNFKQRVSERQGGMRTKAYHEVWSSLYALQQHGDEWLDQQWWGFPCGGPMPAKDQPVCVLEMGYEGGSQRLMASFEKGSWLAWIESNDKLEMLLDDEDMAITTKKPYPEQLQLDKMLHHVGKELDWFQGYPLEIHPWFARRILLMREGFDA